MKLSSTLVRSRIAGGVFAAAVLLMSVIVNLPYRYVERDGAWLGSDIDSSDAMQISGTLEPMMAGWPMRYWIRYESDSPDNTLDRYWSLPRLLINVMLGLIACGLVYGFTQMRRRAIHSAKNQAMTRTLFDVVVALGIVLLPTTWFLLDYRATITQQQLVGRIASRGSVYLSCQLPEPFADRIPSAWVSSLMRIRFVQVTQPDNDLVSAVVQQPSLLGIWISGDQFDFQKLQPLSSRDHFVGLHINRRELTDDDIQVIAQLRWLRQLNLAGTNLDSRLLRGLDQMSALRRVNFTRTPLQLSELGHPAWSKSVERLALPRPRPGSGATLTIDGWPELTTLYVVGGRIELNSSPLELRLSNLPKLERLAISRLQCHALIGQNLPRLSSIDENGDSLLFALRNLKHGIPGLTWFSELQLDGAASLKRIRCYAKDLKSLSIRNVDNLRQLDLGTFSIFGNATAEVATPNVDDVQSWIDSLGQADGPLIVDLKVLPLDGVDLSPLVENRRLQELGLSHTHVTFEQLQGLAGMDQLERLDLDGCRLQDEQLSWLLRTFPNLKRLTVDASDVRDLDLSPAQHLSSLFTTPLGNIRRLRLVDRPQLTSSLRLDRAPDRLEIRNAQSLEELEIRQPWPEDSTIEGLRDLRSFIGGGPHVDDRVVDVLLDCRLLDRLTLAYASLSPQKLAQLGELTALSTIELPGADVDDLVTENWHGFRVLNQLNLDDTNISTGTLAWLSRIESLRGLSINRVALNQRGGEALGHLVQLSALQVADTPVPLRSLQRILAERVMERLDLSGHSIDSALIDALANCPSLRQLKLHRCDLNDDHVLQLLRYNSKLQIDLGSDVSGLDGEAAQALEKRRTSDAGYKYRARLAAAQSYPMIPLLLEAGDFMVYGKQNLVYKRSTLDLTAFRVSN